jgi:glyoxylase-like metal-dependent hydrolase (beta-lactamase superfamily II)
MTLTLRAFTVGPLQENCYLLVDDQAGEAVLVDPGAEGERLAEAVRATGARLVGIWLTHAHFDHVGGVAALKREFPGARIHLHPDDQPLYDRAVQSAAKWGLEVEPPPPADVRLAEGDVLTLGSHSFDVWHAPGHAPGHVVIHGHGLAFVGDCLFAGSVGRTDLPLADPRTLARSLERIIELPPGTRALPGHGPETTIATERLSNPFLTGDVRLVRE